MPLELLLDAVRSLDAELDEARHYLVDTPATLAASVPHGNDGIPHGTLGGYTNHHCRCDLCRTVIVKYNRDRLRRKALQSGSEAL